MKKYAKAFLALLMILLVAEIIMFAPGDLEMQELEAKFGEDEAPDDQVEQSLEGAYVVGAKKEQKEWELWAVNAVDYKGKEVMQLNTVRATFFAKDGVKFKVVGKTGTVDSDSMNMTIEGDVKMESSNGYTFVTEKLSYLSEQKKLYSLTPVKMRGPREPGGHALKLRALRMEADLNTSVMEVHEKVRGRKSFPSGKLAKIKSDRAVFSGNSRQADFYGNVVIDYEAMRVTGPVAKFNYDKKSKQIGSLAVNGGVRVSDLDKYATSERLDMDFLSEKIVFNGDPKVVQDNDELFGDQIIFFDGGKRVQVKKARAKVEKNRLEKNQ